MGPFDTPMIGGLLTITCMLLAAVNGDDRCVTTPITAVKETIACVAGGLSRASIVLVEKQ